MEIQKSFEGFKYLINIWILSLFDWPKMVDPIIHLTIVP